MDNAKAPLSPQLWTALLLHVNQRLLDRSCISRRVYEEAKTEISKRAKTTEHSSRRLCSGGAFFHQRISAPPPPYA